MPITSTNISVNTRADLVALDPAALGLPDGFVATVLGHWAPGDGGGMTVHWESSDGTADNTGTVTAPTSVGAGPGRWLDIDTDVVTLKKFPVKFDGVTNDTAAWTAALGAGKIIDARIEGISVVVAPLVLTGHTIEAGGPDKTILLVSHSGYAFEIQQFSAAPVSYQAKWGSRILGGLCLQAATPMQGKGILIDGSRHGSYYDIFCLDLEEGVSLKGSGTLDEATFNRFYGLTTAGCVKGVVFDTAGTAQANRNFFFGMQLNGHANQTSFGVWCNAGSTNFIHGASIQGIADGAGGGVGYYSSQPQNQTFGLSLENCDKAIHFDTASQSNLIFGVGLAPTDIDDDGSFNSIWYANGVQSRTWNGVAAASLPATPMTANRANVFAIFPLASNQRAELHAATAYMANVGAVGSSSLSDSSAIVAWAVRSQSMNEGGINYRFTATQPGITSNPMAIRLERTDSGTIVAFPAAVGDYLEPRAIISGDTIELNGLCARISAVSVSTTYADVTLEGINGGSGFSPWTTASTTSRVTLYKKVYTISGSANGNAGALAIYDNGSSSTTMAAIAYSTATQSMKAMVNGKYGGT